MSTVQSKLTRSVFYVDGLHCPSCELLIEKKLIKEKSIQTADVTLKNNTLTIDHLRTFKISPAFLNQKFKDDGYRFSLKPFKSSSTHLVTDSCPLPDTKPSFSSSLLFALLFILGYIFLSRTGFSSLISVNAESSLPIFFLFGLLAGVSSCAALVGGIVLSISQQWLSLYNSSDSFIKKSEPHFLFNLGRVLGYGFFGALLGYIGNFFRISPVVSALLVIVISLVMILLGLQMVGVKALQNFQLRLPKSLTGRLADETNFQGRFAPALMGALTFFLPCGFTITAQALALASSSPIQGALIMALFALGTVPGLLAIGLSSIKFYSNPRRSSQFSAIAGLLVLFFAVFNINAQLAVLGFPNLNDLINSPSTVTTVAANSAELPPIVDGKQIVKMDASSTGYTPNTLKVRVGVPIRWEITDKGTSGCTNAVLSKSLFDGVINLVPGTTSTKEFVVAKPGVYRFSCWMGMVSGTLTAVDSQGNAGDPNTTPAASGAKGCGCGGGASRTCGGAQ